MSDEVPSPVVDPARCFGTVADAYHRGRPPYPTDAVTWLTSPQPLTVLELGAGTGKLTAGLVALGHDVHATDPDPAMLRVLERELPNVRTSLGTAEDISAPDRAYEVVVAGQAFHWFDPERSLAEIARVLKPGGSLSLVWNTRDERIPWVRRLGALIGSPERADPAETVTASELFGPVEQATFRFWQTVDRHSIQELVLSRSSVATLDEEARKAKLAEVLAFYDDYGRGMDGMQLPYVATCLRATVRDRPRSREAAPEVTGDADGRADGHDRGPSDGTDTDMLLIDFR